MFREYFTSHFYSWKYSVIVLVEGKEMTLGDVAKNQVVKISALPLDETLSAQLLEQGFALRTEVALAHKAPFNGPLAYRLHNTKISIQRSVAEQIQVVGA